ncbi:MAG: fibronectin type III domain-containing protein [Oscillospiraceae bacterium]|nr:fibronectin type III domain-containing protein [Oscillospiraceae bacterium]
MTFAAANVGYGPQPLTGVVEIDNTGSVPLTGVSASITSGVHAFEIPQQPAATVPNTGASAGWLIVRPRTGLPVGTHNGVLTVTSSNGGSRNVNLSFTVNAGTNLTVNQTSWNPSASWSSTTVSVTSNTSWTVSSSATSWLTVSPSHGSNNGSFTIMAQSNPNATQRSATVTVRTADWAIARNITVTQAALMLAPPPPARSISLTNGPMIFAALPVGYAQPAAQSTVITNNGGQATQQLTVTAPTGFRVSTSQNGTFSTSVAIASIPVGGRAEFWTRPITGLTVAEHRGDVTVRNTTTQTPALTERTRAVSFRVNPAPRVPFAIFDLEAIPGDRRVTLNWTAPNDGGSPITHYEFRQRIGNNEWGNWTSTGLALPTLTRINLTNGVSHSFQVRAVNNVPGDAIGSNTATATPAATVLMVPEELALPSTEHTTTINVTSNTTWTVSVSNDARLWLTVSDITPANRTGNGSFRITVRPNPGPARSGTITVTGGGITRNIRVTQAPRRLTLSARILHDDSALQHHSTAEMQAIFNDATAIFLDIFNVEFHLGNNISRSAELNPVLRSCTLDTICIFGSCENAPECGLNCHTDHCKSAPRMARVQPHSFMYTLRIVGYLTCVYDTSICRITGLTVGHRAVGGLARYLGSRDTIVSNQYIAVATDGFTIEHLIQHELAHSLGARDFYCTVQYCVMKRGTTGRENHLCDNCKADIWNHLAQIYNHSTGFAYEYALIYEHNLTDYSDNAWNNTTYLGGELNEKRKKYIDSDI